MATHKPFEIQIIKSGFNSNKNHFYPSYAIQEAIEEYEGSKVFAYEFQNGFFDHIPERPPEGCVKNQVGLVKNVRWDNKKDGLVGDFHCFDNDIKSAVEEAWQMGERDYLGFSSDHNVLCHKEQDNGKDYDFIDQIKGVNEICLVSKPGAGGKFLRLLESRKNGNNKSSPKRLLKLLLGLEANKVSNESEKKLSEGVNEMSEQLDFALKVMIDMVEEKSNYKKLSELSCELSNYLEYLSVKDKQNPTFIQLSEKIERLLQNIDKPKPMTISETRKYADEHKLTFEEAAALLDEKGFELE